MSEFYAQFLSSGASNIVLVLCVAVALWLKQKVKVSRCKSNCYWFDCEAQLDNLRHIHNEVNTQRGILANVLDALDVGTTQSVRRRASSV